MSDVQKPSEVSGTETSAAATTSSPTSILPRVLSSPPREVHRRIFVPDDRAKQGMHEEMSSEAAATTPKKKRSLEAPVPTPPRKKSSVLKRRKQLNARVTGQTFEQEIRVEAELQLLESRAQQVETRGEEQGGEASRQPAQQSDNLKPGDNLGLSDNPRLSPGYQVGQHQQGGEADPASCSAYQGDDPDGGSSPGYFVRKTRGFTGEGGDFSGPFDLVSGPDSPRTPPGVSTTGATAAAPSSPPKAPQKRDRTMERLPPSTRGTSRRLNFD